ncbi:hypothetical protein L3X38_035767 [Prunus dulcis]|uniref:Uncharacterized protein n=1 Tax=Prunus dulcis TaxID=3755 RepID=A0AAD4YZU8_PRUDU|nr:hypothetical protein L3X38_035767 [Prunus dulcis]
MGRAWGSLCAQYLEIGNLNQKKLKKGIYSSDHSFRASNGRKYGSCRPEASSSESTCQCSSVRNCAGAGVAKNMKRQVLIGSDRRSCSNVPSVAGTVLDPASGIPVSIV